MHSESPSQAAVHVFGCAAGLEVRENRATADPDPYDVGSVAAPEAAVDVFLDPSGFVYGGDEVPVGRCIDDF